MIEKIIYECEYCHKKRLVNKTSMKTHESKCWFNEANKTCLTCVNDSGWFDKVGDTELGFRECYKGIKFDNAKPKVDCPLWSDSYKDYEGPDNELREIEQ